MRDARGNRVLKSPTAVGLTSGLTEADAQINRLFHSLTSVKSLAASRATLFTTVALYLLATAEMVRCSATASPAVSQRRHSAGMRNRRSMASPTAAGLSENGEGSMTLGPIRRLIWSNGSHRAKNRAVSVST